MKWTKDRVSEADVDAFLGVIKELDQRSRNLLALMLFAVRRHDPKLCEALDELHKATPTGQGPVDKPVDGIDGSLLRRLNRICPDDECIWWERALTYAETDGDAHLHNGLAELVERRVAS